MEMRRTQMLGWQWINEPHPFIEKYQKGRAC